MTVPVMHYASVFGWRIPKAEAEKELGAGDQLRNTMLCSVATRQEMASCGGMRCSPIPASIPVHRQGGCQRQRVGGTPSASPGDNSGFSKARVKPLPVHQSVVPTRPSPPWRQGRGGNPGFEKKKTRIKASLADGKYS